MGFATRSGGHETLFLFAEALLELFRDAAAGLAPVWPDRDAIVARARELMEGLDDDPVVTLPPDFVLMARVFAGLGGLFTHYRPDVDYVAHVVPVLAN